MFHFQIKGIVVTILSVFFISSMFYSQNTWSKKLKSQESTFQEVKEDFNQQWEGQEYQRGHGWKQFHRWENFWENRLMPDGRYPDFRNAYVEFNNYMANKSQQAGNWLPLGPFDHDNTDSWSSGSGRINVIVEDPNNSNIIYIGAPAGGIWKTTNAGNTWTPLGDDISVIGVSGIAVDPIDGDIIYIATGDSDAGDTYNVGLMKSTDGGSTWNLLQDIGQTNEILMDPTDNTVLWASSSNGLYKTTDSGATWVQMQSGNMRDMAIKPGDSQTVYGVTSTQVFVTTDGGTSFSTSTGLSGSSSRLVIGVSDDNPSLVYIIATNGSGGFDDLYKSLNSGNTFTGMGVSENIFSGSDQSWYDLAIGVSDADADILYCGVLNIWKSTNGGSSWTEINSWSNPNGASYTHADIHYLNYYGGNFYCGSDGGIYKSTNDGTTFTDLTAGLQIGQFYKIGGSPNDASAISGGLQDNGGFFWNGTTWRNYYGADGMDNAVDPNNSNNVFGMIQYGGLYYSTNAGLSNIGAPDPGQTGNWVTPTQHDMNNDRLIVGYDDLFEFNTVSHTWNQLSTQNFPNKINNIEIYDGNSNIIVVSSGNDLFKTTNNGTSFTDISGSLPSNISSIEMNPTDDNEMWVTIGGWSSGTKVYHTTNNGGAWTNISNGLPNLPTHMIKYDATNDGLYLGMDIGVYFRNDILGAWIPFNTNLPNVIVNDIEINEANNIVRIGTFGRGVWESGTYNVPVLAANALLVSINSPEGTYCVNNPTPQISVRNIGTDIITDLSINFNYDGGTNFAFTWSGSLASGATEIIDLFAIPVTEGVHTYNIDITLVNGGADEDPSDNTGTSNFEYVDGTEVIYSLTTDCYGYEVSWVLREQVSGDIIEQAAQNTLANLTTYTHNYCLTDQCYELQIDDSFGDGLSAGINNCASGDGIYGVVDGGSNPLVTMATAAYGSSITEVFCLAGNPIMGCMNNTACNYNSNATQDDGNCVFALGCDTCSGATDGSGTVIDNLEVGVSCDDGNALTENDVIGNDCNCSGTLIIFGCMNNTACNYDSNATQDDGNCAFATGCDTCSGATDGTGTVIDNPEVGVSCDDGNALTENDVIGNDCNCAGTLIIFGCMNNTACNYDSNATQDDGNCVFAVGCDTCSGATDGTGTVIDNPEVGVSCDDGNALTENDVIGNDCNCAGSLIGFGCMDNTACNYDSNATQDNGNCVFAVGCDTCSGATDGTGTIIDNPEVGVSCDDGNVLTENDVIGQDCNCTGTLIIFGCMNNTACNYNSIATQDDGNCVFAAGCDECSGATDGTGTVIDNPEVGVSCDDGNVLTENDVIGQDCNCSGTLIIFGCTNNTACNYNSNATQDDASCVLPDGCTNSEATNFDSNAQCDDGSCVFGGCLPISDFHVTSSTGITFSFQWDSQITDTYMVEKTNLTMGQVFNPFVSGVIINGSIGYTSYLFQDLQVGSTYEFRVRNICSPTWSAPIIRNATYSLPNTSIAGTDCNSIVLDFTTPGVKDVEFTAVSENVYIVGQNITNPNFDLNIQVQTIEGDFVQTINTGGNQINEAALVQNLVVGHQYVVQVSDINLGVGGTIELCAMPFYFPKCNLGQGFPEPTNLAMYDHTGAYGAINFSTSWTNTTTLVEYTAGPQSSAYFNLGSIGLPNESGTYDVLYTGHYEVPASGGIGLAGITIIELQQVVPCQRTLLISTNNHYLGDYYSYGETDCVTSDVSGHSFWTNINCKVRGNTVLDHWRWKITDINAIGNPSYTYETPTNYRRIADYVDGGLSIVNAAYIADGGPSDLIVDGGCYSIEIKPNPAGADDGLPFGPFRILITKGLAAPSIESLTEGGGLEQIINREYTVVEPQVAIYPNPSQGDFFNLNITEVQDESIVVVIYDMFGRLIQSQEIDVDSNSLTQRIKLKSGIVSGIYTVMVTINGTTQTERLIIEK